MSRTGQEEVQEMKKWENKGKERRKRNESIIYYWMRIIGIASLLAAWSNQTMSLNLQFSKKGAGLTQNIVNSLYCSV